MNKEKIIQLLQIGSLVLFCLKNSFANAVDNGECPLNNPINTICVQLHNTGDIDIAIQAKIPAEPGIQTATSDNHAHYDFGTSNGYETFDLLPASDVGHVTLDASCAQFAWAYELAEGKKVTFSDLSAVTYSYAYGYKKDKTNTYMMIGCNSEIRNS